MTGLRARWQALGRRYNRVRPTAAGGWYLAVTGGVSIAALNTGNNLLYLVLATLLAILVVNNLLAELNLRGLHAERRLPTELFAGEPGRGFLRLVNPRRLGDAFDVEVAETGPEGARAVFPRVAAGTTAELPATWTFPARGWAAHGSLRVGSAYPFGLLRRYRDLDAAGAALVYPGAEPEPPPLASAGPGWGRAGRGGVDATGELTGIRPWAPGDPVRRVHGPTSARHGAPMVVLRATESGGEVVIEVPPDRGEARERALRRACARVRAHADRGEAVGLRLDGLRLDPSVGAAWRRRLLTALALAP